MVAAELSCFLVHPFQVSLQVGLALEAAVAHGTVEPLLNIAVSSSDMTFQRVFATKRFFTNLALL